MTVVGGYDRAYMQGYEDGYQSGYDDGVADTKAEYRRREASDDDRPSD